MIDDLMERSSEVHDDEIDLRELFLVLWQGRVSIILYTFIGAVLSVGYALSLPNIYESEVMLAPKAEGSGLSGLSGQLGGLAGLAGIEIGGGEANKTQIALETLKSREFFAKYLYEEALVPLMASTGWDHKTGELVVDEDSYDVQSKKWVREVAFPFNSKPSIQEAYPVFKEDHISISEDKKTGFVELKVKHYSPIVARDWLELMLKAIEASVRTRDVTEAEKSIAFLKSESETNSLISLNEVFANLIEEQTKKIVLANASEEYVFQVIEPSVIAEFKAEPKRAVICILGCLLAGMLSVLYVLVRHYVLKKTELTGA
jgi:hypothetical protein